MRILLLIALSLLAMNAKAESTWRFESVLGQCKYSEVGNYIWFNDLYPYKLDMSAGCALLAISKVNRNEGNTHLGWRLAYTNMGTANVDAIFPMRDEDQAAGLKLDGSGCAPSGHGCLGHGKGAQKARGFSIGVLIERDAFNLTWDAEGGVFVYEGAFHIDIEPVQPSKLGSMSFDFEGWQATPFIGLSARYGYLMVMYRVYGRIRAAEHGCGGCSGVANGTAYQALIGLSVPF